MSIHLNPALGSSINHFIIHVQVDLILLWEMRKEDENTSQEVRLF